MHRRALVIGVVLAALLAVAGCGDDEATSSGGAGAPATAATTPGPRDVERTTDVPVTDTTTADVYAPTEGGPWPVVVLFHGLPPGMDPPPATRQDLAPLAEAVAEQGAVVVNASYEAVTPEDAVGSTACALQVAAEVGAEHGGDPERLVAVGHSAGALPALAYGLDSSLLDEPLDGCASDASAVEVRPGAVVTVAGGFDVRLVAAATPAEAWHTAAPAILDGLDVAILAEAGGNASLAVWVVPAPAGAVGFATVEGSVAVRDALVAAGYEATLVEPPLATHVGVTQSGSEDLARSVDVVVEAMAAVMAG